jgi:hypothetical protein
MRYKLKVRSESNKMVKKKFNKFEKFTKHCYDILENIEQEKEKNELWLIETNNSESVAFKNNKEDLEFISLILFKRRFGRNKKMTKRINTLIRLGETNGTNL